MVPAPAAVVVVGNEDELLHLPGREAWPFPQDAQGDKSRLYPADSAAAIAQLEELRTRGGQYLLVPQTELWWLEHYPHFAAHLARHYRLLTRQDHLCVLYQLQEPPAPAAAVQEGLRLAPNL
jgi:hypothetical protein